MNRIRGIVCMILVIALGLPAGFSQAALGDYIDADALPAKSSLRQALDDGLIDGSDGHLLPDEDITLVQALTIICRVFDAQLAADISDMDLRSDRWYYDYVAKALHLGLISSTDKSALTSPLSRQDAFSLLAEAFQLIDTKPDLSVLERFNDSKHISENNRKALASLVSKKLISGYGGSLHVNGKITRSSFISVVYRIIGRFTPSSSIKGSYESSLMLKGSAGLFGNRFSKDIWFDCMAKSISLSNINAESVIIRSHSIESFTLSNSTYIKRLVLAAQAGDITVSPDDSVTVNTLVIGSGNGEITSKNVGMIEVTGNGRSVMISGQAESVVVTGRDCILIVQAGAHVERLELQTSAQGSRVVINGTAGALEVKCSGASVAGSGSVAVLRLYRSDTAVSVLRSDVTEKVDVGLTYASLSIKAPDTLPAGNSLRASATLTDAAPESNYDITWYVDGVAVISKTISAGDLLPELAHKFDYSPSMKSNSDLSVAVRYTTSLGDKQEIFAHRSVKLENYSRQYWMQLDAADVLKKVTIGYLGNFTLEWALNNDLTEYEKEVWVNAKGYTSQTEYLLWINLAYQRVNIFKRSDGYWELIRTCLVGTGAPGRGTPPGVWTTSYKQVDGWTTDAYTVKPVVRFMDSVGYAFHSRLYYPFTTTMQDPSIGYPISNGCVRMYDEDIWFIYDNVPDGTTVVVH